MNTTNRILFITLLCALFSMAMYGQKTYLSPTRVAVNQEGTEAYVVLSTAQALAKVSLENEALLETIPLKFNPSDVCCSIDGKTLYATEYSAYGKLHLLSPSSGETKKSVSVGAYPAAIGINKEGTIAWVANRFSNDLSVIDLKKNKEIKRLAMVREPKSLALSPDGKILAIGNFLSSQSAVEPPVSAQVTLVDTEKMEVIDHVVLPDGSQSIADVCFSKDGSLLYVTHLLSRYPFPTTQLERGWMNTNALSLIDISVKKHYTTVLLDDMYRGVANPCGMAISEDGNTLFVAASGTHELVSLNLPALTQKIKETTFTDVTNNLTFLSELKTRIPLSGKGARYPFARNGKVFVTDYFSGGLSVIDEYDVTNKRVIKLGEEPEPDEIRKGELFFSDAALCFQNWQSCVSCHPEARVDGLNWDLVNDGLGNPKNTKSMLYAHVTPPSMMTGIRANAEVAVRAGIKHIQFATRPEEDAVCIDKYLQSITPLPSPYLTQKGELSKPAKQGEALFKQTGCLECHYGEYYTDGKMYNVGTGIEEYTNVSFDTPTLKEIWRTAPYLYNGSAKTIKEVLTTFNREDKHGITSNLSEQEIEALEEYILSL